MMHLNPWMAMLSPLARDEIKKPAKKIPTAPCAKCHQAPRHDRSYCKECRMALNRYYWPRRVAKMKGMKL
jgi:hypothetical protein